MTSISNRNKHLFVTETRVDKKLTPEQVVNNYRLLKKYMPEALIENIQEKHIEDARPKYLPRDFGDFTQLISNTLHKNSNSKELSIHDHELLKLGKEGLSEKIAYADVPESTVEVLDQLLETLEHKAVKPVELTKEDIELMKLGNEVLTGKTVLFDAVRNNEYLPPCRTHQVTVKKSPKHKKNKLKELNKMVSQAKAEQRAKQQAKLLDITSKTAAAKQPSIMQNIVGKTKSIIRKALQTALSKAALL